MCSPTVITKVIKPIIAFLGTTWNIIVTIYFDDMLIQAISPGKVILHARLVMLTFMALGWSFEFGRCKLIPSQGIYNTLALI